MKVQAAPELLARGMVGDKSPNKGDGAVGDKAAAFGALLEIGQGKSAARGAQPMVEGGDRDVANNKPGEFARSDEKALTNDLLTLGETLPDESESDRDPSSLEDADVDAVIGPLADQHAASEVGSIAAQQIAPILDESTDASVKTRDGDVEAPVEPSSAEPAVIMPADQSTVAVTSMALFFTLTNSLRAAGAVATETMRPAGSKSSSDPVSVQAAKAGLADPVDRVGDLISALPPTSTSTPTPMAGLAQTPARLEGMSVLEGMRAALTPSAGETAGPIVAMASTSGDNMAGLGQNLASLTPVTKQIQSVLVQQIASGDFASKVDEVMLARNATNARVNNGAIMVTLSPANLGEVTIKLVNRGDVVQIVLQASTDEAAGQIMRDRDTIADLVQTLARKSAHVVVQAGMETGDGQTRAQEDGSRRGQSGDEGRSQSDMFGAGRDERGGRQHDPAPPARPEPSPGGEILI